MFKQTNVILTNLFLISLLACGGANQALISTSEIENAQASGKLISLYEKANTLVSENRGSAKKEAINIRTSIVQLLVAEQQSKVDSLSQQYADDQMSVDRVSINAVKQGLAPMQQWSATDYSLILSQLESIENKVDQQIASAMIESKDPDADAVTQVLALQKAAKLAGEGQPEQQLFLAAKDKAMTEFLRVGSESLQKRQFDIALQSAESGLQLDRGSIQFESMLSQAQAGLFESEFRRALESGKPESAYSAMLEVADQPIFNQIKKPMTKSLLLLANYFAGSAEKAYLQGDFATAYVNFNKGRNIQQKIDVYNRGFIQEKKFIDQIMNQLNKTEMGAGSKQAMMRVVTEFDKNYPGIDGEYLKVSEIVKNRAMTKLAVAEFKEIPSDNSVVASVGRQIGSKLEKILFERLGNELLIIAKANASEQQSYNGLILQIDGEMLQAVIETSTNNGKRTLNVQTSVSRFETEEYQSWAKRKRGEQPLQYIETPMFEDVELTVSHIRKQAIAEVAFRIIEPANGAILLTDNFVIESEFTGESINEFQKGDFHQVYVRADLPSDIKIMDALASELAVKLGEKLTEYLKNPEQVFYQKAVDAKSQGNNQAALELLANAIAIAEGKGSDVSEWVSEIKMLVLQR